MTLICLGLLFESARAIPGVNKERFEESISTSQATFSWYTVIELELILFFYIHSTRSSDFNKFVKSLKTLLNGHLLLVNQINAVHLPFFYMISIYEIIVPKVILKKDILLIKNSASVFCFGY